MDRAAVHPGGFTEEEIQQQRRRSVIDIERHADVAEISNLMDLLGEMRGEGARDGAAVGAETALVHAIKAPSFSRGLKRPELAGGLQNISETSALDAGAEGVGARRRSSRAAVRARRVSTELFDSPESPRTGPLAGSHSFAKKGGGEGGRDRTGGGEKEEGNEEGQGELPRQPSGFLPSNLLSFSGRFVEPRISRKRDKKSIFFSSGPMSRMSTFKRRPLMAKYFLHADSQFLQMWKIWVAIITLYTAILTPFHLGFQVYSTAWGVMDCLIDVCFIIDIMIQLRSGMVLANGRHLATPQVVFEHLYRTPLFYLDILAALPVSFFTLGYPEHVETLLYTRFVKICRMINFSGALKTIIKTLTSRLSRLRTGEGEVSQIAQVVFYLALFSHWGGCIYAWLVKQKDYSKPLWVGSPDIDYDERILDRYFVSFAWALTVLTGIGCELLPTDYHESLLFMGLILGGVFAYATILGNVYAIIHSHGQEERTFRKHVDNILGYMDFRSVDNPELRARIISYYNRLWERTRGHNEEGLLQLLSRPLRLEVLHSLNTSVLEDLPLLRNVSDMQKSRLCDTLMQHFAQKGDTLIMSGEPVQWLYCIMKGSVELHLKYERIVVPQGFIIGIDNLLLDRFTYEFSATALEDSEIVTFSADDFLEVSKTCPSLENTLKNIEKDLRESDPDSANSRRMTELGNVGAGMIRKMQRGKSSIQAPLGKLSNDAANRQSGIF